MSKVYAVEVDNDGDTFWRLDGKLHREGGPAIEYASGSRSWYRHGKPHCEDGPAVEWANGDVEYWLNGKQVTRTDVMGSAKELTVAQIEELLGHKVKVAK